MTVGFRLTCVHARMPPGRDGKKCRECEGVWVVAVAVGGSVLKLQWEGFSGEIARNALEEGAMQRAVFWTIFGSKGSDFKFNLLLAPKEGKSW